MSDEVNITLTRDGRMWRWTLHVGEEEHIGQRPEESADIAAIAADNFRRHLDLRENFKRMKAARAAQA